MFPLTLLAAKKFSDLLSTGNALAQQIATSATACNVLIPVITPDQVVLSSASPSIGDKDIQLTYPRVCLYSLGLKNAQTEKFRSLSGTISVVAEVWASGNLVDQTDQWIHFYVDAVTGILRRNIGDWNDGVFFPGTYDVQFQPPASGGLGYVQSAKISCVFNVSQS